VDHLNRKKTCESKNNLLDGQTPDSQEDQSDTSSNDSTDNNKVQCEDCKKMVLQKKFERHKKTCKGVPLDTCKYCLKKFDIQQSLSRHQKMCKEKMFLTRCPLQEERGIQYLREGERGARENTRDDWLESVFVSGSSG
jgi:hypothetical protein